MVIVITEL